MSQPPLDPSSMPSGRLVLVGCGVVGSAIAADHLRRGVPVTVADRDPEAVARFARRATEFGCRTSEPVTDRRLDNLAAVSIAPNGPPAIQSDGPWLAIESVAEDLSIKRGLFGQLQTALGRDAVFCSNTSTIPIHRIADGQPDPSRFCGMHFFMPVAQRPAVEIIAADQTDPNVIAVADKHARRIGKTPLHVADTPGFVVNRLLSPYLNESLLMLGQGVTAGQLADAAERLSMAMSPLRLIDTIGIRTAFDAGRFFWQSFPHRVHPSPILARLIKLGRRQTAPVQILGPDDRTLSTTTAEVVLRYQTGDASGLPPDDIAARLLTVMIAESEHMRVDGLQINDQILNTALTGGLGWQSPAARLDHPNAPPAQTWTELAGSLPPARRQTILTQYAHQSPALTPPPAP